jgi:hypothetical protein
MRSLVKCLIAAGLVATATACASPYGYNTAYYNGGYSGNGYYNNGYYRSGYYSQPSGGYYYSQPSGYYYSRSYYSSYPSQGGRYYGYP